MNEDGTWTESERLCGLQWGGLVASFRVSANNSGGLTRPSTRLVPILLHAHPFSHQQLCNPNGRSCHYAQLFMSGLRR
jgi:hypothetical protein